MRRRLAALAVAGLWIAAGSQAALGQASAVRFPPVDFQRGGGLYLFWVKLAAIWLVFLIWVSSANWVNADAQRTGNKAERWNLIAFLPFAAAFLLLFVFPSFWIGFPLLILAWAVPLVVYVRHRNAQLPDYQKVMTRDHLWFLVAERLNAVGIKVRMERQTVDSLGPPFDFIAQGGATERDDAANLVLARQSPGYVPAKEILVDALDSRADSILMDFTSQNVDVRYQIDGVWHPSTARDRETGDAVLAVLKQLSALKPAERRARQQGRFGGQRGKRKLSCKLVSQGSKTGERAIVSFVDGKLNYSKLAELGMPERLQEKLLEVLRQPSGLVLVSAPPQGGLSMTFDATINSMDRYTRSFIAIEDQQANEREIENVPHHTYDPAAGETPLTILPKVARLYPDVIVCRNLPDAATVTALCEQTAENRLVLTSIRAKEAAEALLRVLMLKVPPATLAPVVTAVLGQRLVRKLCGECKEAYAPPAQILKSLGIPPGKVEAFYRPPQPEQGNSEPCAACAGLGYKGRTAFFELIVVDDPLREVLTRAPKLDLLRQQARKSGMRTLQEEGLLLVVKGVTSLAELTRVLKE